MTRKPLRNSNTRSTAWTLVLSVFLTCCFAVNSFAQVKKVRKDGRVIQIEHPQSNLKVDDSAGQAEPSIEGGGIKIDRPAAYRPTADEKDFSARQTYKMRGSFVMIGNGNVNIWQGGWKGYDYDYNGDRNNNTEYMGYVDLDDYTSSPNYLTSSSSTFNSSMSELLQTKLGSCAEIKYVGLYWAAMYEDGDDYDEDANDLEGADGALNEMLLSVPGKDYETITADDIIVDRDDKVGEGGYYACYADVTNLVKNNPNGPFGEYWGANIKAFTGYTGGNGTSAMWVMVVVYENPEQPARFISIYDGFKRIARGVGDVDFGYSGFSTIPNGTVKAKFGIATLEGERNLTGDQLLIEDSSGDYEKMSTGSLNDEDNFFNSNITVNDNYVTTRDLTSENTFGADIDVWTLNNNSNQLIDNNQTAVNFRLKTVGDAYAVFLNAFAVDIIQPKLQIVKKVEDVATGSDITGQTVNVDQAVRYILEVTNTGNDNAINTEIVDHLPNKVDFTNGSWTFSESGITADYDTATHTVTFDIPDNIVEIGESFTVSFGVTISNDCEDYVDACGREISNMASATYDGDISGIHIQDDGSVQGVNACGSLITGASNVILGTVNCQEAREELLCNNFILTAGNGFISYEWTKEGHDADGDGVDDVIGTTQSINITSPGTYHVYKEADPASGCPSVTESIKVVYDLNIPNPLDGKADAWGTCSIDGSLMAKIFLCGKDATRMISTGMTSTDITWQKLVAGSCASTPSLNCPSVGSGCQWQDISTAPNYEVTSEGEYRIVIKQGGCQRIFYFNVFENNLDVIAKVNQNIICGQPGEIVLDGVPGSGYEFSLNSAGPWQDSPVFGGLTTEGTYTIYTRKKNGTANQCIFSDAIYLPEFTADFNATVDPILCPGSAATIHVSAFDGKPNYTFELLDKNGVRVGYQASSSDNDYDFTGVTAGDYTIIVTSSNGTCTLSKPLTIAPAPDFSVTATATPITCNPGTIDVAVNTIHGLSELNFYIIYPDGTKSSRYFENDFPIDVTVSGNHTVEVVGPNGCTVSDMVTFDAYTAMTLTTTGTPGACATDPGSIEVAVTDGLPPYTYILDEGLSTEQTITASVNTTETFTNVLEGEHTIKVTDAGNCEVTANVTLTNPAALTGDLAITANYTCAQDATLTVQNVSGGTPPYTYTITGTTTTNNTGEFNNITDGNYTVTITDASGVCSFETNEVTVDPLNAPSALTFSATPVQCGATNQQADITVTVADGNPDFTFAYSTDNGATWSTGGTQTGAAYKFNGMAAGTTYTFRVTDAKGCAIEKDFTLNAITPLSISGNVTKDVTCINGTDGEYHVAITNGSGNFSYKVLDGSGASIKTGTLTSPAISFDITGLAAGNYTVEVTDTDTNCVDTLTFTIAEPTAVLALTASATEITCAENATITAVATGGWGTYQYTLEDAAGTVIAGPQTTNEFSGITTAGTYTVRVADLGGCETTAAVEVKTADKPSISLDTTNSTYCATGTGASIAVTVNGGATPYTYTINGGADTDGTPNDGIFKNLPADDYTIAVTDANGCTVSLTAPVTIEPALEASTKVTQSLTCKQAAEIELTMQYGYPPYGVVVTDASNNQVATTAVSGPAPYTYTFSTNTSGTYTFEVTDSQGCAVTLSETVAAKPQPIIDAVTPTGAKCFGASNGSLQVDIQSGSGIAPFVITVKDNATPANTYTQTTGNLSYIFTGLAAGSYTVTVTGAGGCASAETTAAIGEPGKLQANITVQDTYTCLQNATFEATVTGGTAPYTYTIGGETVTSSNLTEILDNNGTGYTDGNYTLTITDANDCTATANITVDPLNAPSDLTFSATTLDCTTSLTSDVTVTVVDGNADFTFEYSADGGATWTTVSNVTTDNHTFDKLSAGSYLFKVTDAKGCSYEEPYTINSISQLSITGNVTANVTCKGGTDGSLHIDITGGSGDFSYTVNGATLATQVAGSFDVTGLKAGSYTIEVTDDTYGCTDSVTLEIKEPAADLTVVVDSFEPIKCNAPGSLTFKASGGWATSGYVYTLTYPDGTTTATNTTGYFDNLTAAGTYTVVVKDKNGNGCSATVDKELVAPTAPNLTLETTTNYCSGGAGAEIVVSAAGGAGSYSYELSGSATATNTTGTFSGLSAGSYTVTVTDAYGCTDVLTTNVVIEAPLSATAIVTKGLDCSTSANATIELDITGGYPSYTVELIEGASNVVQTATVAAANLSKTFSVSAAGTYHFKITDAQGCTFTTPSDLVIASVPTPSFTYTKKTDVTCNGAKDGTITVDIDEASGNTPFEVSIDGGATYIPVTSSETTFTGLAPGNYTVTIRGAGQCTATETVTISEPTVLTATLAIDQAYVCGTTGATLQASASGGTTTYSYELNGVTNTTGIFNNAGAGYAAGTYIVTVTDANKCTTTAQVTVEPLNKPTAIEMTSTDLTCNTGKTADVTVTVTAGGNQPFDFEYSTDAGVTWTMAQAGVNATTYTITNLPAGDYIFRATGAKGCAITGKHSLNPADKLTITGNVISDVLCKSDNNGILNIDITGGSGNYSYTVDGGASQDVTTGKSFDVTGLAAGTYTILVTDDVYGCTDTIDLTITEPTTALSLALTSTPIKCIVNGTITATASDGWGNYSYTITYPISGTTKTNATGKFTNLTEAGTYTVVATDKAGNGCAVTETIALTTPKAPTLTVEAASDLCASAAGATIETTVAGGSGNYTYTINGQPDTDATPGDGIFEGLSPGSYEIVVTDDFGCSAAASTQTVLIEKPVAATAVLQKPLTCVGTANAEILVTVTQGYAPYTLVIKDGIGTQVGTSITLNTAGDTYTFSTPTANTYTFEITDAEGCTFVTPGVTVYPKTVPDITAVAQTNPILCHGSKTGAFEITLDPALGTSPFTVEVSNDGGATWTNYGTQTIISGLAAGTYDIRVTGQAGCFDTASIDIVEPADLTLTTAATNISCSAAGTVPGSITATAGGGTGPYTYHLISVTNSYTAPDQTLAAGSANFANLPYGIYQIQVSDANGCSIMKQDKVVSPPNSLDITIVSSVNCATGATMKVVAGSLISGAGNYYFAVYQPGMALPPTGTPPSPPTWIPETSANSETAIFTGMTPGITYTFVVYDAATGCYYIEKDDQMVPTASTLTVTNVTPNPVACATDTYGSVDFTIDNYNGDVKYSIYPESVTPPATPVVTGTITAGDPHTETNAGVGVLTPGSYYILFEMTSGANAGCAVASNPFTIEKSATPLTIATIKTTNDNCNPNAGTISVTAQGGTAPYEYSLDGSTWQTENTFNVESGPYTVYVRDAYGCSVSQANVNVKLDPTVDFTLAVTNQCSAGNGQFTIKVTRIQNGVDAYAYNVNGGDWMPIPVPSTDPDFEITGLSAGTHTIGYQGVNGCVVTKSIEIYAAMDAEIAITQVTCSPGNDGTITVTMTGGSGNFSYALTDSASNLVATNTTGDFTGLPADTYTLTVTDTDPNGNLCTWTETVTLVAPVQPVVKSITPTDVKCFGDINGTVTVVMEYTSLTDPDYTYTLYDSSNAQIGTPQTNNGTFTGLGAGDYYVIIASDLDCAVTSATVTVSAPAELTLASTVSTFKCDTDTNGAMMGEVTLTAGGGTGPYTYSNDGTGFFSPNIFDIEFKAASYTHTFYVKDANGCVEQVIATIPAATPLTDFTVKQTQDLNCDDDGTITVDADGGSGNYTYTNITNGQTAIVNSSAAHTFTVTTAGTFQFKVVDNITDCVLYGKQVVDSYDAGSVVITDTTNETCPGDKGTLTFKVQGYTGAFSYILVDGGGTASAAVNVSAGTTTVKVSNLPADTYHVEISQTDDPFCNPISGTVEIKEPAPININLTNQNANCNSGALITVSANGGTGPYTYAYVPDSDPAPSTYGTSNQLEIPWNATQTDYDIYVKDANGCTSHAPVTIDLDPEVGFTATVTDQCTATNGNFSVEIDRTVDGVGPYKYKVDSGIYLDVPADPFTITGLSVGSHTIYYRSANGCATQQVVNITAPLDMTLNITETVTCATANAGEITATVTGGSGNYTYTINDGTTTTANATNVFTGLQAGITYTIEVTDTDTGCTVSATESLAAPTKPVIQSTDVVDVLCHGSSTGSVEVVMDGSTLTDYDYTYVLYNQNRTTVMTTQTNSGLFENLAAGTYDVVITSAIGCSVAADDLTISEPSALTLAGTVSTFSCQTDTNNKALAVVTLNPTGGTGSYTYSVDGISYFSLATWNVPFSGTSEDFFVQDANGCVAKVDIPIPAATPLTALTAINGTTELSCSTDEKVVIQATGGSGNYIYTLVGSNPPSQNTVTGGGSWTTTLSQPGTYTFKVEDQSTGCVMTVDYVVDDYPKAQVTITGTNPTTCANGSDGDLTFEVTGDYTGKFSWAIVSATASSVTLPSGTTTTDPSGTTEIQVIDQLPPGVYYVEIDELAYPDCNVESTKVTIGSPDPIVIDVVSNVNANCNSGALITLDVTGGTGAYTYAYVPTTPPSTPAASDYSTANPVEIPWDGTTKAYTIFVKDANGCTMTKDVTIAKDPALEFSLTLVNQCLTTDGNFQVKVDRNPNSNGSIGVAPYTYSLDGGAYQKVSTNPFTISNLSAGKHTVTYRSANGCEVSESITILEPLAADLDVTASLTCGNTPPNDGEITATATGGSGNYSYKLSDGTTTITNGNDPVFTGLSAGTYTLTLTDNVTSCTTTAQIELLPPTAPVITGITATDVKCHGGSDGTVTVTMDPSTLTDGPYTYALYTSLGVSVGLPQTGNPTFTGVPAGTYIVKVTSDIGCEATSGPVTIKEPTALVVSATATGYTCSTGNTPEASTVTISALDGSGKQTGTAPYTYSIDGVNWFTDDTFTVPFETAAQNLTVYVKDANGCETSAIVTVEAAQTMTAVNLKQTQQLSCVDDETVDVSVTGGSGDYTVTLLGTTPPVTQNITASATSVSFTLTAIGTYTFQVTDNVTNCVLNSVPYEVKAFNTATVDITAQADASCVGVSNGSLSFVVKGYTGDFAYALILNGTPTSIKNGTGTASATMAAVQVTGLGEGVYSVQITETAYPKCTVSSTNVTIKEPTQALSVDAQIDAPLTCAGNDATIKAYAYGGNGNYQYRLEDASGNVLTAYQSSPEFTGLSDGSYTVRVKSGTGVAVCDATDPVTINAITPIDIQVNGTVTNPTCYAGNGGSVTVQATGGGTSYMYVLEFPSGQQSAPQASPTFSGLTAGTYSIIVTDNLGCSDNVPVTITEPQQVLANATVTTQQTCNSKAEVTVTGSQGVAPYTYSIDGTTFGTDNTFEVGPGAYTFYVKDKNGCVSAASSQITINQIETLELSLDTSSAVVNCHDGADASVFAIATGGLGNYQFTLYASSDLNTPIAGPQASNYFSGLSAGDYTVEVSSGNCAVDTETFSVVNPPEIISNLDVTQIRCAGEANGAISINATGGTGQILYSFDQKQWFVTTDRPEFKNLRPGTYTVYIQDEAGCMMEEVIVITDPEPLVATSKIESQNICAWQPEQATVSVSIAGGEAPYYVSMTGKPGSYTEVKATTSGKNEAYEAFVVPNKGQSINFWVKDSRGCDIVTKSVQLSDPIDLTGSYELIQECGGANTIIVTVADESLLGDIYYTIDNGAFQTSNVFENVPAGVHDVGIIHSSGCTNFFDDITIEDIPELEIVSVKEGELNQYTVEAEGGLGNYEYQMNNGSVTSDNVFEIEKSGFYTFTVTSGANCIAEKTIYLEYSDVEIPPVFTPNDDGTNDHWMPDHLPDEAEVVIFDRYGRKLGEFKGTQLGWNGRYNGKALPSGDYWFWIKMNDGTGRELKGHFTLIR